MGQPEIPNEREAVQHPSGDGGYTCRQCGGDWYGCGCPRIPIHNVFDDASNHVPKKEEPDGPVHLPRLP